nr:baseplate wedge subunit [Caudoviricetes sp.]
MLPDYTTVYQQDNIMPSKTYYINRNTNRISGYIDDKDAIIQAIYLILSAERYESVIYNWYYGTEFDSLIGKDRDFVKSELKRRIAEAILEDDRILDVTDFDISFNKDVANVVFLVETNIGDININWEVNL